MSTRRTLLALVASTAVAASLAACGGGDGKAATTASPSSSAAPSKASSVPGRAGDITFAQQMIPHHQQAVQMADMALRNGTASAKVKSLAMQIKKAQAPEIATMTGWLKSWKAPQKSGMSGMGDMGSMDGMMSGEEMSGLGAAKGAAFDKQWVTLMIAHHRGAVTMSNSVLKTTSTQQVKSLAQEIITAQNGEIKTMQAMLTSK